MPRNDASPYGYGPARDIGEILDEHYGDAGTHNEAANYIWRRLVALGYRKDC